MYQPTSCPIDEQTRRNFTKARTEHCILYCDPKNNGKFAWELDPTEPVRIKNNIGNQAMIQRIPYLSGKTNWIDNNRLILLCSYKHDRF